MIELKIDMQGLIWLGSNRRLFSLLLGMATFLGASNDANADYLNCANGNTLLSTWRASFTNVQDNPNIAVGSVLATATVAVAGATQAIVSCGMLPGNGTGTTTVSLRRNGAGDIPSSNVNGASLRFLYNGAQLPATDTTYQSFSTSGNTTLAPRGLTVQLIMIKTAANPTFNNGNCLDQNIGGRIAMGNSTRYLANITACVAGYTRAIPTCTVNTTSITIPLSNVTGSSFANVGSVSTTTGPQNIGLSCSYSPRIRMTLQGTPVGGAAAVLPLTGAGTAGVAGGVGVQVLYRVPGAGSGENLLTPGAGITLTAAAGATVTVPIFARYARTGTVTADRANAAPTLLFDYP